MSAIGRGVHAATYEADGYGALASRQQWSCGRRVFGLSTVLLCKCHYFDTRVRAVPSFRNDGLGCGKCGGGAGSLRVT